MDTTNTSQQSPTPFFRLLSLTWASYKRNFTGILKIFAIPAVLLLLLLMSVILFAPNAQKAPQNDVPGIISQLNIIVDIIVILIVVTVFLMIFVGITLLVLWPQISFLKLLKLREENKLESVIQIYKKSLPYIIPFLWVSILSSFAILGGFLLFIIPGIIFSIWFIFSGFAVLFEEKRGVQALLRSKQLVSGHWWRIFFYSIILGILTWVVSWILGQFEENYSLFSFLKFVVNIFFLNPLITIFTYELYKDQLRLNSVFGQNQSARWIYVMLVFGIIAIILLPFLLVFIITLVSSSIH